MSFVLYTQILKQSVLKPASPGITLSIPFQENFGSVNGSLGFESHCIIEGFNHSEDTLKNGDPLSVLDQAPKLILP